MLLLEKRINEMHTSFVVPTHQLTADKLKDEKSADCSHTEPSVPPRKPQAQNW